MNHGTGSADNSNYLNPPEEQNRRKVGNINEVWVPCEYCEGEGVVLSSDDVQIEDDVTGEPYTQRIEFWIQCPHCKGELGQWDMEIDE